MLRTTDDSLWLELAIVFLVALGVVFSSTWGGAVFGLAPLILIVWKAWSTVSDQKNRSAPELEWTGERLYFLGYLSTITIFGLMMLRIWITGIDRDAPKTLQLMGGVALLTTVTGLACMNYLRLQARRVRPFTSEDAAALSPPVSPHSDFNPQASSDPILAVAHQRTAGPTLETRPVTPKAVSVKAEARLPSVPARASSPTGATQDFSQIERSSEQTLAAFEQVNTQLGDFGTRLTQLSVSLDRSAASSEGGLKQLQTISAQAMDTLARLNAALDGLNVPIQKLNKQLSDGSEKTRSLISEIGKVEQATQQVEQALDSLVKMNIEALNLVDKKRTNG